MANEKRLIEIPSDGIVSIPIMCGDDTVGERRIDLSFLPTVDAVEVVRCKDCVHMKNQFNARFCNVWCMYNGMGDEGFCNYGERRSDA